MRGNEYGWALAAFPDALRAAEANEYACIGGQFQFRIADAVYEMYWLNADAIDRTDGEPWSAFCHRSCTEVSERFDALVANSDFRAEAGNWPTLSMAEGFDLQSALVFVAYFITEREWSELQKPR